MLRKWVVEPRTAVLGVLWETEEEEKKQCLLRRLQREDQEHRPGRQEAHSSLDIF